MTRRLALAFDMDGTLLDGRAAVIDAVADGLAQTYRHFSLTPPPLDRDLIAGAIGLPTSIFFRRAYPPGSVPTEIADAFAGEFEVRSTRAEVAALLRGQTSLYAGVEAMLSALAAQEHELALYSNASEPYFEAVLAAHGLRRWFTRALCLEQAVRRRLARDKKQLVRHLVGGHGAALVIGDRVHDIEAGRAAGARTVGCRYGFGRPEELAGADWCIDAPAELLELPPVARAAGG